MHGRILDCCCYRVLYRVSAFRAGCSVAGVLRDAWDTSTRRVLKSIRDTQVWYMGERERRAILVTPLDWKGR